MIEPPRIQSVLALSPVAAALCGEWHVECSRRGADVLVYETGRTDERQAWLYASGRTREGPILTHARPKESRHNYPYPGAWDAVPWSYARGVIEIVERKLDWSPFLTRDGEREFRRTGDLALLDPAWRIMVEVADDLKIEWAGRWRSFREFVHFQIG